MTAGRLIRWSTAGAVLLVAAIAAVVSFVHIEHLALTHGQAPLAACLLPLSIDGTVAAASMVMLRAARAGLGTPWLARFMLGLAVAATLLANIGYGMPFGWTGALISGWPACAFVGTAEMAIGMVRRARTDAPGAAVPVAADRDREAVQDTPRTPPVSMSRNRNPGPSRKRARKPSGKRPAATPGHAEKVFADVLAAGRLPSLRAIKTTLHVGTPRARELRDHLEAAGHLQDGPETGSAGLHGHPEFPGQGAPGVAVAGP